MAVAVTIHRAALAAAAALAPALAAPAWAAGSAAPFKPPASTLGAPAPSFSAAVTPFAPAVPAPEAQAAAAPDEAASAPQPLGLTGIRRGARSAALIDGAWVDVGQTARGARLVAVSVHGVHLAHPDGRREFLALSPEARWSPHRPADAAVVKNPVKEGRP